jgi:hypothetical protein
MREKAGIESKEGLGIERISPVFEHERVPLLRVIRARPLSDGRIFRLEDLGPCRRQYTAPL